MIGILDIYSSDIVSQQNNFVCVQFLIVFPFQILLRNQATLQQTCDKCSCSCKRVQNMNVFVRNRTAKLFLENIIHRMDDEIHNLDWRINNTQLFNHFGKCSFEKLVIQLNDDSLFSLGIVDTCRAGSDGLIKLVQNLSIFPDCLCFQEIQHLLHGNGNRVILNKRVTLKQGLKYRLRNNVLSQHFDSFQLGNGWIDIFLKSRQEILKRLFVFSLFISQLSNSLNLTLYNDCNIFCPLFPVFSITNLIHHSGIQFRFRTHNLFSGFKLKKFSLLRLRFGSRLVFPWKRHRFRVIRWQPQFAAVQSDPLTFRSVA